MKSKEYDDYLQSNKWKILRKSIINKRKKCERCGYDKNLQVHHKHYRTIFNESPNDLELLCARCHMKEHGLKYKSKSSFIEVPESEITLRSHDIINAGFTDMTIFSEEKKIIFYDVGWDEKEIIIWGQNASYVCVIYYLTTAFMIIGSRKKDLFKGVVKTKKDFIAAMDKAQVAILDKPIPERFNFKEL